jgi:ABC-type Fe3+-hydroxamate transport system substrate-binding protein
VAGPERIVSLCPSITETLVALGAGPRLVGVTRWCVRPREDLAAVERIGGTKTPDVARIAALAPELVFANAEENREEDVRALRDAGIEVDVTLPRTVAQVPGAIRQWGRALEAQACAEDLARAIEESLEALASEPSPRPFRYAYWIWRDPWMTVSDDTYVADLLRLAGGVNAYGGEESRYPETTPAAAAQREIEIHLFPDEPYPFREERHGGLVRELFPSARRLFVPGDDWCWHGARSLEGLARARELAASLSEGAGA